MPKERSRDAGGHYVEQLIDKLYSCENVSEDDLEEIRMWLAEDGNNAINSDALRNKFMETLEYEESPKYATEMWPEIAERLGLDVNLVKSDNTGAAGIEEKAKWASLRRKRVFKVAAVLMPLLVIGTILGFLVYKTAGTTGGRVADVVTVTVSVAADSVEIITLPDGSVIELRRGSTLTYAENFKYNRHVTLEGEALFTVTKDAAHPFTVESETMKITVLGTEFYVKAYGKDGDNEVTVKSGEVLVTALEQTVKMEAMQRLSMDKEKRTMELSKISDREITRLRGLSFSLNGHTLDEAFRMMSQFFGVEFRVASNLELNERLVAGFEDDITLNEAMSILKLISHTPFDYKIEKDTVTIIKRK